ncbi:hypothetical protein EMCRGX_G003064 [Ephydatia muelleri]
MTDKSYEDLAALLQNHFNPAPAITVQRFKFNYRTRQNGENVATFVSELRQLAMRCDFGAFLEELLRDRLVCGIKDEHIQRRLLAETNLTFKKAQDIAQALESADRNTADLQQQVQGAVPVHALKKSHKPKNDSESSTSAVASILHLVSYPDPDSQQRRVDYITFFLVMDDGSVQICGDFKDKVNKYAKVEEYPLPLVDDLFASLTGGQVFTKLDLAKAYLQLMMEESISQSTLTRVDLDTMDYAWLTVWSSTCSCSVQWKAYFKG